MKSGALVISLDFELFWGVRDKLTLENYGKNILGVRRVVPALLQLFQERNIACTWATVGLLFHDKKPEMLAALPACKPQYVDRNLSPYDYLPTIGDGEASDHYHFGLSLVRQIAAAAKQEIGTHTFSHYYCLEDGANAETFRADLAAAKAEADRFGVKLTSIVFPRNQYNPAFLPVCREFGLRAFRGNERIWFHHPNPLSKHTMAMRGFRFADRYLPIGGAHDHQPIIVDGMVDVPASRLLAPARNEPYSEKLRLNRIKSAMQTAARKGSLFHLWWHPHDFGGNLEGNLAVLRAILDEFDTLRERHDMRSMTMADVANEVLDGAHRPAHD